MANGKKLAANESTPITAGKWKASSPNHDGHKFDTINAAMNGYADNTVHARHAWIQMSARSMLPI